MAAIGIISLIVSFILMLGGLILAGLRQTGPNPVEQRLTEYRERTIPFYSLEQIELSLSVQDRIIIPTYASLLRFLLYFVPGRTKRIARQLSRAGLDTVLSANTFVAIQVGLFVLISVIPAVVIYVSPEKIQPFDNEWQFVFLAVILAIILPPIWLEDRVRNYQRVISSKLPDALDLLVMCVEAGLGWEAAMERIDQLWDNALATEFGRVSREIQLGKPRHSALRDMANRLDTLNIRIVAAAIIQAEQIGIDMETALRTQATMLRLKQFEQLQEQIDTTLEHQIRMQNAVIQFIFLPAVFLWLIAPIIGRLFE